MWAPDHHQQAAAVEGSASNFTVYQVRVLIWSSQKHRDVGRLSHSLETKGERAPETCLRYHNL